MVCAISGCKRREAEQISAQSPAPSSSDQQQPEGSAPLQLTEEGRQRSESVRRSQPADPRDSTFASQRPLAIPAFPYDYLLGRLNRPPAGSPERDASAHAREFLLAVRDQESYSIDTLPPGARRAVAELAGTLSEGASLRIGPVAALSDEEFSVRFRFVQTVDTVTGELIVALDGGDWYTSDIQIAREGDSDSVYEPGITVTDGRSR